MMTKIDSEGITRIASLMLRRHVPATRIEAMALVRRHLGAYDANGEALYAGVDAYFSEGVVGQARH